MNKSYFESLFAPVGSSGGGVGSGGGGASSSGGGVSSGPGGIHSGSGGVSSASFGLTEGLSLDAVPDPNMRRADRASLHPAIREAVRHLEISFNNEGLPFRVFEAYRSPQRQAWLYAQGRTRSGNRVTDAQAWQSYHQYGLAVDFVLWLNNTWSWSDSGIYRRYWTRLHDLGRQVGLEPLSWEAPHLQVAGLRLADLQRGVYPDGGDDTWRDNLEAAAIGWHGEPEAPSFSSVRPIGAARDEGGEDRRQRRAGG